jgi:predicted secreted hydrolase
MKKFSMVLGFLILFSGFASAQNWKTYPYSPEGTLLSFPADEGRHEEEPIEWWYTSGHLTGTQTGNQYSFMVSYFYYPLYGYDGFRILNLSNENTGQFYNNTSPFVLNQLGTDSLNIDANVYPGIQENWNNKVDGSGRMIPFEYVLSAASQDASLNLNFVTMKRPLILADSGLFYQGSASYTYYYSFTKNEVSGEISFEGVTEPVSGTAWIDRQFGTFNPLTEEDYEWFCIQLSNEMDINLWNVFSRQREIPEGSAYRLLAAYVDENTQITTDDFEIERLAYHFMPDSARCYAQQWRLTSTAPDLDLVITTLHQNNEVDLPFRFFEGATYVTGSAGGLPVTGKGFAELLHSYAQPQVELIYPAGSFWNSNRPISWRLKNPDDGRPVKYTLECSIDNKLSFFTVAGALNETSFYWNEPDLVEGNSCWFRVTAFSVDSVLIGSVISSAPSAYEPNLTAIRPHSEEQEEKMIMQIYPNPANNRLIISLNEAHPYQQVQVLDILGSVLMERKIGNTFQLELDTGQLVPGLYTVKLASRERNAISRIIIHR